MWNAIAGFAGRMDVFWFLQIAFQTAAWVLLGQEFPLRKHFRPRILAEYILLFLAFNITSLLGIGISSIIGGSTNNFLLLRLLGQSLITAAYMRWGAAGKKKARLILWLALTTVSMSATHIGGQASLLVGQYLARGAAEGFARIFFEMLTVLAALYLKHLRFDEYPDLPNSSFWMLGCNTACVLALYVAETVMFRNRSGELTALFLLSYTALLLLMLMTVQALSTLCKEQQTVTELQAEKQRYLSEREQSRVAEAMLHNLRAIRHDLKNQYSYMQILLAEKRYAELEKYFADLQEGLPAQMNIVDCGNRTVNTVLNMEFSKLRNDRIALEHQLVVPPVLPFRDEDLIAILTNLLDNAGEECRRLLREGRGKAQVRLEIYPHQSYLYIRCLNSTDRTALERRQKGLRTTKKDAELHGYGTQIIAKLAEKYNGLADYTIEGESFVAKVMLDLNMEEVE